VGHCRFHGPANSWNIELGDIHNIDPLEERKNGFEATTLWLFNIAMENGPFIDGLSMFIYKKW
jgi:hypothetical protein